ncbi:MAG: metallophosphoesterase family protein [Bacteroidales bacterium]
MKRIGLLSDTHGFLEDEYFDFLKDVDEIWHAGDVGDHKVSDRLEAFKPLRAVYGNIDGYDIRVRFPEHQRFDIEGLRVWMTHIGGYPGRYAPGVRPEIYHNPPGLFISGHSHILKVMNDKKLNLLHINPGAAGKRGLHKVRTVLRFIVDNGRVKELEILEKDR